MTQDEINFVKKVREQEIRMDALMWLNNALLNLPETQQYKNSDEKIIQLLKGILIKENS